MFRVRWTDTCLHLVMGIFYLLILMIFEIEIMKIKYVYEEWSNLLFSDFNTALTCFWNWFKPLVLAMASQHACTLWFEMVFAHVLKQLLQLLMASSIYMNRNPKQHDQLVWTLHMCESCLCQRLPLIRFNIQHPPKHVYIYTRILQIEYCQGIRNDEFKTSNIATCLKGCFAKGCHWFT